MATIGCHQRPWLSSAQRIGCGARKEPRTMNTIRKVIPTGARLFLGLVFTIFGLNFFLHFMPTPPAPPRGAAFAGALFASGYLFPLLNVAELVAGVLLLSNRFVPLALTVLAPIVINIVGFHIF